MREIATQAEARWVCAGTRCPSAGLGDRSTGIDAAKEPEELSKEYLADYYLTTIEENPGDIAPQYLRGFSINPYESVQTPQNHWAPTVSHLTA